MTANVVDSIGTGYPLNKKHIDDYENTDSLQLIALVIPKLWEGV